MTEPLARSKAANRLVVALRTLSCVTRAGVVGSMGRQGAVRSRAWICDFSSTHSTRAFSGGLMYRPTTSRTLSMNCGSVDSFHVCTAWCLSPNARQIRDTAVWFRPADLAIDRVDQW